MKIGSNTVRNLRFLQNVILYSTTIAMFVIPYVSMTMFIILTSTTIVAYFGLGFVANKTEKLDLEQQIYSYNKIFGENMLTTSDAIVSELKARKEAKYEDPIFYTKTKTL